MYLSNPYSTGVKLVWIQSSILKTDGQIKAKEPSLLYYSSRAGGGQIDSLPFLRKFVRSEMPIASSRIWSQVTNSISYDANHYTKFASVKKKKKLSLP